MAGKTSERGGRVASEVFLEPELEDLRVSIKRIDEDRRQGQGSSIPEPQDPFVLSTRQEKGRVYYLTAWTIPDGSQAFTAHCRIVAADGTSYRHKPHTIIDEDIDEYQTTLETELGPFPPEVQVDIVRAKCTMFAGPARKNPIDDDLVPQVPNDPDRPPVASLNAADSITDDPSAPSVDDIVQNEPDETTAKQDAIIGLRVWASGADHMKSFGDVGANGVTIVIRPQESDDTGNHRITIDVDDLTATSVNVYFHRHLHKHLTWVKNVTFNQTQKRHATNLVNFRAGKRAGDHTLITFPLTPDHIVFTTIDPHHSLLDAYFTIGVDSNGEAPEVRRVVIEESDDDSTASFHIEKDHHTRGTLDDGGLDLGTAGDRHLHFRVKHPKDAERYYRIKVFVDGDHTPSVSDAKGWLTGDDGSADPDIPDDAHGPSYPDGPYISRNVVAGDPRSGVAEVTFDMYADATDLDNLWGDYPVREISVILQGQESGDKKIHFKADADPAGGNTGAPGQVTALLEIGKEYAWLSNVFRNSSSRVERGYPGHGDLTFVAGDNYSYDATDITSGSCSISVTSVDPKHSEITVNWTQPSTPVLLKKLVLLRSRNGGTTYVNVGVEPLIDEASIWSVAGAKSYTITVKHPKNTAMLYGAILVPYGSNRNDATCRSITSSSTTSADENFTPNDTAAPGAPGLPTIRFRKGHMRALVAAPSTNINSIYQYEWQFSSVNTFASGNFLQDNDATPITTTISTVLSSGPKISFPFKKGDLSGSFSSMFFRVRAYNRFSGGTAGSYSSTNSVALSSFDADFEEPDTVLPPTFSAPTLRQNRKAIHGRIDAPDHTTDGYHDVEKFGWLVRSSSTPTLYLTEDGGSTTSAATAEFFTTNNHFRIHAIRSALASAHKTGVECAVRAYNSLGAGTFSSYSSGTGAIDADAYADDTNIPLGRDMAGRHNMVTGGEFVFCTGLTTGFGNLADPATSPSIMYLGKNWWRSITPTDANRVNCDSSQVVYWDYANAVVRMATGGSRVLMTRIPPIRAGKVYWLCFLIASITTNGLSITGTAQLLANSTASIASATVSRSDINNTFQALVCKFTPSFGTAGKNGYLYLNINPGTDSIVIADVCLVKHNKPQMHEQNGEEIGVPMASVTYTGGGGGTATAGTNDYKGRVSLANGGGFGNDDITSVGIVSF